MDTSEAFLAGLVIGIVGIGILIITMLSMNMSGAVSIDNSIVVRGLDKSEITFWTDFIKANPNLPEYVECNQIPKIVIEPKEVKREIVIPIGNVGCP